MKMMEIKCAGRGGQGAVVFSQILAIASFNEKKFCQAMPTFGVERRGAPSFSFTRISKQPINLRTQIYNPDVLIVLDASLLKNKEIINCVKKDGIIIVNTSKNLNFKGYKTFCTDASLIALRIFNQDIVNTPMLGAVAAFTKLISIDSLYKAVEEKFHNKPGMMEKNKRAIKEVYESCLNKK